MWRADTELGMEPIKAVLLLVRNNEQKMHEFVGVIMCDTHVTYLGKDSLPVCLALMIGVY